MWAKGDDNDMDAPIMIYDIVGVCVHIHIPIRIQLRGNLC